MPNFRQQLARAERFRHAVIAARCPRLPVFAAKCIGGNRDDWDGPQLRIGFNPARGCITVHDRELSGSTSYGKLTAGLRDTPDAVVLLDEFEKAHADVHKNFLTAWNDGFVTEASDGRQISTTRALFVLTTNAAVDALADLTPHSTHHPHHLP